MTNAQINQLAGGYKKFLCSNISDAQEIVEKVINMQERYLKYFNSLSRELAAAIGEFSTIVKDTCVDDYRWEVDIAAEEFEMQ